MGGEGGADEGAGPAERAVGIEGRGLRNGEGGKPKASAQKNLMTKLMRLNLILQETGNQLKCL